MMDYNKNVYHIIVVIISMVSILSNALIIHVVRMNSHMRTTTNYFIVNMACGDLVSTISTTATMMYIIDIGFLWNIAGVFGEFLCN